jgi:uncharacterized protein YabE (DUF348 family)
MKNKGKLAYAALVIGIVVFFVAVLAVQPKAVNTAEQAQQTESVKDVTSTESIPYKTTYVDDPDVEYGKTVTKVKGQPGTRTYFYKVVTKNGNVVSKELTSSEVTRQPVDEVIGRGTKIKWRCLDVTSYDYNWQNDMMCTSSTGEKRYTSYSGAEALERQ